MIMPDKKAREKATCALMSPHVMLLESIIEELFPVSRQYSSPSSVSTVAIPLLTIKLTTANVPGTIEHFKTQSASKNTRASYQLKGVLRFQI